MSQTQGISDVRSSNWGIWASIVILAAAFLAYFFAPQFLGATLPAYAKPVILAVGFILAILVFFVSPTGKTFIAFSRESFREANAQRGFADDGCGFCLCCRCWAFCLGS